MSPSFRNTPHYDNSPIPLTPEGVKRLKERLLELKASLPERIAETARTAAYGDRSDNAEYKEAKMTLRRTQRQIRSIEDQLRRVEIILPGKNTSGQVRLGSTVVLESETGTKSTFQIVGPYETNPDKGRISHLSPLGAALIGHTVGETTSFKTDRGMHAYLILEIH